MIFENSSRNTEESFEQKHISDFFRMTGHKVINTSRMVWASIGLKLSEPRPFYNRDSSLSSDDLRYMWKQGAMFLHYFSSDDKPFYPGYILLVEDGNYDLDGIDSDKRRHHIRWAIKRCTVERIPFELLVQTGGSLVEDTYRRQGRKYNEFIWEMWKNYFRVAESNPLFEAWGAFVFNQLAAFQIYYTAGGGVYIDKTYSRTELLKHHPIDALVFVFTQQAMNRDGISYVSYGHRPIIGETPGLLRYKESMGFRKVVMKERLEINPMLKPLMCGGLKSVIKNIAEHYSDGHMRARILAGIANTICGTINGEKGRAS